MRAHHEQPRPIQNIPSDSRYNLRQEGMGCSRQGVCNEIVGLLQSLFEAQGHFFVLMLLNVSSQPRSLCHILEHTKAVVGPDGHPTLKFATIKEDLLQEAMRLDAERCFKSAANPAPAKYAIVKELEGMST